MSDNAKLAIEILQTAGHQAFFVGGCVRDEFLGLKPKDFDIVTSALPDQVASCFTGFKILEVGIKFGITILVINGEQIEIATFRKDSLTSDGRRPDSIEFSGPLEDTSRRDFTINALLKDPITGEVVDHHGGLVDLKNKVLRCVGDPALRMEEDQLRSLRAIRLACKLNLFIDPRLENSLNSVSLSSVSNERIRDEFLGILGSSDPVRGIWILQESGLLAQFLPELSRLENCTQDPIHHPEGDVFTHSLEVLKFILSKSKDPILRFAALLHDIGKFTCREERVENGQVRISNLGHDRAGAEMAKEICQRLRFTNEDTKRIVSLVDLHMVAHLLPEFRKGKLANFFRVNESIIDDLILLQHADACGCWNESKSNQVVLLEKLEEFRSVKSPDLVNGSDLIKLGLKPGPRFKEILLRLRDLQDEGLVSTKDQALAELDKLEVV